MAKKTILSHFYNEEWLLPFWLKHHREIFDHGILIDYKSTDRSVEIIKELCPTWEVHTSRNEQFEAGAVDNEIVDYERPLEGWRATLNTTEFLVGNYEHMNDDMSPRQILVNQLMFTDMERREEPFYLDSNRPLWEQRWWGYRVRANLTQEKNYGTAPRAPRSIHNHAIGYPVTGRHWNGNDPTFGDLCIFYYGFASLEEGSIKRKMQIQNKCPGGGAGTGHYFNLDQLMERFQKEQQPMSYNMREEIKPYVDAHNNYMSKKKSMPDDVKEHIRAAVERLTAALGT